MTNFAHIGAPALPGKHNMASEAFQKLRAAQADGSEPKNSMSFGDLIDTVNPLQHIPVVSSIYRELTGDTISNQARIAGGTLYGGPIGFVASMIDSAIDEVTGDDLGGHIMAGLFGNDRPTPDAETIKLAAVTTANDASPLITGSIAANPPAVPLNAAAKPAAAKAQVTAAINTPGSSGPSGSNMPPQPMPQLSTEAFNALIGSFADPQAAKKANAGLAANVAKTAEQSPDTVGPAKAAQPAATMPQNLAGKMQSGLDQLEALKAANARSLSLNAVTQTGALSGGY
jgi:hypothetical protein